MGDAASWQGWEVGAPVYSCSPPSAAAVAYLDLGACHLGEVGPACDPFWVGELTVEVPTWGPSSGQVEPYSVAAGCGWAHHHWHVLELLAQRGEAYFGAWQAVCGHQPADHEEPPPC